MDAVVSQLPHLNALCNLTSTVALLAGFYFIRSDRREAHRNAMLTALSASALFLVGYLTRYFLEGTHYFPGEGWVKVLYLVVLFTHMVLATLVVPLVGVTLYYAFNEKFDRHRAWAKWTFPTWLYVSVTGLFVYVMLYWIYVPA